MKLSLETITSGRSPFGPAVPRTEAARKEGRWLNCPGLVLAIAFLAVAMVPAHATAQGLLTATPSVIQVCDDSALGSTTLTWTAGTGVEVRVGAPNGPLFAATGPGSFSKATGKWVGEGTTFYLQVTGGLTAANTLASITVRLTTSGCPIAQNSLTANPNPIPVCDGSGHGATTLTWSSAATAVEVRVGAPDGQLFAASGSGTVSKATGKWVDNDRTFYLQNVTGGLPLTAQNTLARATVRVTSQGCRSAIEASPNPIPVCDGSGFGVTTLMWTSSVGTVEVRVGAPNGALFARSGPGEFAKAAGKWISHGQAFYLQNVSGGLPLTGANTLATVTVAVIGSGCPRILAEPNPIPVCDGSGVGATTLTWTSTGTTTVEVHLDSPTGPLFARTGPGTQSAATGEWVTDGKAFYLQNVSGGLPLTPANTLAVVSVETTTDGCPGRLPPGFVERKLTDTPDISAMAFSPDGRLFLARQGGEVLVFQANRLLTTPFVTLETDSFQERGVNGITFDPDFAINQYVYVYYTAVAPRVHNRVSRFTAMGNVARPGSEVILLELDDLATTGALPGVHNGGALHFGPDGKLYVAVGENGISANAQTLSNRLGKILRINKDGSIPPDNPFYASTTGDRRAIWALGLRNPFTFAFQPTTGRMYINDVGASLWEEINEGLASANYGWPLTEGATSDNRFVGPIHAYAHGDGEQKGCAITGGTFYDPPSPRFPGQYIGKYFFMDFCNGWIKVLDPVTHAVSDFAANLHPWLNALVVSPDGALYYASHFAQATPGLYRIEYTGDPRPAIGTQPADQLVQVGDEATFSVTAFGAAPLSYQWRRDGVDIPQATAPIYVTPAATAADNGAQFQCVARNAHGEAVSEAATLTVATGRPPTATITSPPEGTFYTAGQTITYAGMGTDVEDGALPASRLTWEVLFLHLDHFHPFVPSTTGVTGGSFVIPKTGETSVDVAYRIILTVTDSDGLVTTTQRDVLPRTAQLTVTTTPPGLTVTVDGQPTTAPALVPSVVGMTRTLGVISPQTVGGVTWVFDRWLDGGAATHSIATPATDTAYRAVFR